MARCAIRAAPKPGSGGRSLECIASPSASQAFGPVVELTVEESDDGLTLTGRVEFEEIGAAKAAIEKYDGVDMGLGTTLELQSL